MDASQEIINFHKNRSPKLDSTLLKKNHIYDINVLNNLRLEKNRQSFYINLYLTLNVIFFGFILFFNLHSILDFVRSEKEVSFIETPIKNQNLILENQFCKHCKKNQKMKFIKELSTQGIKRLELECIICNTKLKIRK